MIGSLFSPRLFKPEGTISIRNLTTGANYQIYLDLLIWNDLILRYVFVDMFVTSALPSL